MVNSLPGFADANQKSYCQADDPEERSTKKVKDREDVYIPSFINHDIIMEQTIETNVFSYKAMVTREKSKNKEIKLKIVYGRSKNLRKTYRLKKRNMVNMIIQKSYIKS